MYALNLGISFITLREPCNNQRPRCDIAWLHVINYLYHHLTLKTNGFTNDDCHTSMHFVMDPIIKPLFLNQYLFFSILSVFLFYVILCLLCLVLRLR